MSEAPAPGPDASAAIATLPAPYNTGDVQRGRVLFAPCMACHAVDAQAPAKKGPNLHGLFGRKVGSVPGYNYSAALQFAGFNWDAAHLDAWLQSPKQYIVDTKMAFVGLPKAKDRVDLIAYLKAASSQ
jgi:cytochrome c